MADLEIMSPIAQSILQWDKACQEESADDNFDLGISMNGQEEGYMDHTFHTPSFGDEEFDIPPINLPPTTPGSDTNSSDVYGTTQPLTHQDQPTQQQQQQQQNNNNQQQHHMMSSPQQQQQMSPCSQTLDRIGPVMTTSTAPMMTSSFSNQQQQHMQHLQQQPQMQQQQQYGIQQHQNDMYMLHIAPPGSMMPPQSVQFHVQQYLPYQHPMQHQHQLQQQQQMGPHQTGGHMLLPPSPMMPRGGQRGSPPNSNHTSPGLETSEDSDDSGMHLSQLLCSAVGGGVKRPSPSPPSRPPSVGGKPPKKPKVQKKKKKRDPNEPQKPVSAYALFFRDTQAAIKGQNPNASFGEVSKIVASMWDGLDIDHKNVYKKKTEAAKKEYLKALAAYRASLVSKAANEQSDSLYGSPTPQGLSPLQKKSPLLTSLMEGSPQQGMPNQQSLIMQQNGGGGMAQHMGHQQMLHQMLSSPSPQQQHMMQHMGSPPPNQQHMMQQHHNLHLVNNNNIPYTHNMQSPQHQLAPHPGGQPQQQPGMMQLQQQNSCSRNNDSQQQQQPQDWERDYCNNDCVVSHCRDVFTTWVAARPPQTSYASVK